MKKFLTAMALLACTAALAVAGPNAGGTILVHYAPVPVPPEAMYVDGGLTSCDAAVTQAPPGETVMWFAYAAFPVASSPRLKVVTFGCDFDINQTGVLWSATYPDATVLYYPDQSSWPYPGSGAAVGFATTLTGTVNEIYCFAGYSYAGTFFSLVAHPDQGGTFADDNPNGAETDVIAGYGSLGFGVDGVPACPVEPQPGACCFDDGHCEFVVASQCAGTFLGEGTLCDPNPCPPAWACCINLECFMLTRAACEGAQGVWYDGQVCTPDLCNPNPVEISTWGQIKNNYR